MEPKGVEEDLSELNRFLLQAKRPRVRELLTAEIDALNKLIPRLPAAEKPPAPSLGRHYVTVGTLSWDQSHDRVKIYVPIENAASENVESSFDVQSFDVKVNDVDGKNYKIAVSKLCKEIVPEQSTVSVKPKRVLVSLKKKDGANWNDLYFKSDPLKPTLDKGKDPMAGIMDLMKNMYEEGDENMKRTIAKAWTDARTGKAAI